MIYFIICIDNQSIINKTKYEFTMSPNSISHNQQLLKKTCAYQSSDRWFLKQFCHLNEDFLNMLSRVIKKYLDNGYTQLDFRYSNNNKIISYYLNLYGSEIQQILATRNELKQYYEIISHKKNAMIENLIKQIAINLNLELNYTIDLFLKCVKYKAIPSNDPQNYALRTTFPFSYLSNDQYENEPLFETLMNTLNFYLLETSPTHVIYFYLNGKEIQISVDNLEDPRIRDLLEDFEEKYLTFYECFQEFVIHKIFKRLTHSFIIQGEDGKKVLNLRTVTNQISLPKIKLLPPH